MIRNYILLVLFSVGVVMMIADAIRARRKKGQRGEFTKLYIQNRLLLALLFAYIVETQINEIWNLWP